VISHFPIVKLKWGFSDQNQARDTRLGIVGNPAINQCYPTSLFLPTANGKCCSELRVFWYPVFCFIFFFPYVNVAANDIMSCVYRPVSQLDSMLSEARTVDVIFKLWRLPTIKFLTTMIKNATMTCTNVLSTTLTSSP